MPISHHTCAGSRSNCARESYDRRKSSQKSAERTSHSWPYMAQGKAYITPLILTSICLVAAERIPRYHDLRKRIASSALGESVVNATPGLAFAPGQDIASENGLEPDLDLELGIGPEEIVALLVYASFSCSPRSDVVARTAFEWTRGYLKASLATSAPLAYC